MKKWFLRFILLLGWVSFFTAIYAVIFEKHSVPSGNVAHIKIHGPILTDTASPFMSDSTLTSSTALRDIFEEIDSDSTVRAILLEINSPGGTPVASSEIATLVDQAKVPVIAWIRETGASGAYWVAASCDRIIAHPLSITGSIGVIASHFGMEELLPVLKIKYRRKTAGELKDLGSIYREETDEEKEIFSHLLDTLHQAFKDQVSLHREGVAALSEAQKNKVFSGLFFTGMEAMELGLVDELGGMPEVLAYIEHLMGEKPELVIYKTGIFNLETFFSKMVYRFTESFYQLYRLHIQSTAHTPQIKL